MVISAFAVKRSFFSDPFRDSLFQAEIFCVFAAMTLRLHFCSPFTLVATFRGPLTFGGGSVAADHGPNMAQLRSPARSVGWVARQLPTSVVARNERAAFCAHIGEGGRTSTSRTNFAQKAILG